MTVINAIDLAYRYGLINGFLGGTIFTLIVLGLYRWATNNLNAWKPEK